jgi:2-polyprenyl-3-methyl-5-hydroxy-6-metoxy-1,4-benzoquinol methylase
VEEIRTAERFYAEVDTAIPYLNDRLAVFVDEYERHARARDRPLEVLDVGCGRKAVLSSHVRAGDSYCGCDIAPLEGVEVPEFHVIDLNSERLADKLGADRFDVVFCGEVIEHVYSPDDLVEDLKTVMRPDALLLLSTPNLGYWLNRLLLLAGISPLFAENSSRVKLGRRTKLLGQNNRTEGHIRLFTYGAMRDFLKLHELRLLRTRSTPVWSFPPDRLVCRLSPSLAPDNTYVVEKSGPSA